MVFLACLIDDAISYSYALASFPRKFVEWWCSREYLTVLSDPSSPVLLGLWLSPSCYRRESNFMCTDGVSDPLGLLLAVLTLLEALLCLMMW